jgi:hypothetical protein
MNFKFNNFSNKYLRLQLGFKKFQTSTVKFNEIRLDAQIVTQFDNILRIFVFLLGNFMNQGWNFFPRLKITES